MKSHMTNSEFNQFITDTRRSGKYTLRSTLRAVDDMRNINSASTLYIATAMRGHYRNRVSKLPELIL